MTRPTICTTSTCDLRGEKKITASSDGTSTPSLRHRTLNRIRHLPSSGSSRSHASFLTFSVASMEPSMCSVSHERAQSC